MCADTERYVGRGGLCSGAGAGRVRADPSADHHRLSGRRKNHTAQLHPHRAAPQEDRRHTQ